jgi:hypothetical protein
MKKLLILLALLVSLNSFGQKNILNASNQTIQAENYSEEEYCLFPNLLGWVWVDIYTDVIYRYIKPLNPQYYFDYTNAYFTTLDFELIEQNKDSLSNKSELKKDNNVFTFEFYKSDNVNTYENPKNLKSFTALLDKKYLEVEMDSFGDIMSCKLINTKGRKKNRFKYTYNRDKVEWVLDYFDTGNKYTLNLSDPVYRKYDKYQLVESSECDGNKLITKYFDKNGQISDLYEAYVEILTDESEIKKTILTKYYPSGNISALTTTDEIWASIETKRGTIRYDAYGKRKDKLLERKSIFEAYSEDGVFSIKNDSAHNINNGDIINVFKKNKNGKKEIYSTINWSWNSKKWEKSFKGLIKTLNSF